MNEVLIYGEIWEYPARAFHESINSVSGDSLTVRINSPGGEVYIGWGMIAMFSEFAGDKTVKVDGRADSMAFYFLCYVDSAEALDIAGARVHRAALSEWYEKSDFFSEADRAALKQVNDNLRAALAAKVPEVLFQEVTGYSYGQLFSMDDRLEIQLNAKDLKKLGLISKITKITPTKTTAISSRMSAIAASFPDRVTGVIPSPEVKPEAVKPPPPVNVLKPKNNMTLEEVQVQHPGVFAQILAMGIAKELDRVKSWTAFHGIDPVAVIQGIDSGAVVSAAVISEMSVKSFSKNALNALNDENAPPVETPEAVSKVTADPEFAAFEAKVKSSNNIK